MFHCCYFGIIFLIDKRISHMLQDQVLHETDEQEEEQKMLYTSNLLKAIGKEMDIKHLILIDE